MGAAATAVVPLAQTPMGLETFDVAFDDRTISEGVVYST